MAEPEDDGMMEEHKRLAAETFNLTWDLMDRSERTQEEDDLMVHAAHASRYHWGKVGNEVNFERGDWQISRVYAVLGRGSEALHHARSCLDTGIRHEIADFDIAFALEAMARAHAVEGDWDDSERYVDQAMRAAEGIAKNDDREYFLGELATVPDRPD